jgi:RNA polymerase sigma factor (sigma-70 family)
VEGRPLAERQLVERARSGDRAAYEELVLAYGTVSFRTAYLLTGSAEDAEEAAQDGFVKAWRALPRFRPDEPFRPWLLRIVANEAKNRRRSTVRRTRLALEQATEFSGDAAPSPEDLTVATERRERLLGAVEQLPEAQRDVVVCR